MSGLPHWCVAIAIQSEHDTEAGVVFHPMMDEMFTARRGAGAALNGVALRIKDSIRLSNSLTGIGASHRTSPDHISDICKKLMAQGGMFYRNGSGALMLAAVAAGRLGGYYEPHMHPWDCLAGLLLVREAGGRTLPMPSGATLAEGGIVLAAAPEVWQKLATLTGCR